MPTSPPANGWRRLWDRARPFLWPLWILLLVVDHWRSDGPVTALLFAAEGLSLLAVVLLALVLLDWRDRRSHRRRTDGT